MVFHQYLWINVFVWALVLCGIRYYQSASWDCSGVIQKIHMRKIRWRKDQIHLTEIWQISCLEDVRQAQMDVSGPRGPRWRAMSSYHMARRTGFREQYYTGTRRYSVSGKIAGNIKVKLYVRLWWLFAHISGSMYSFELSSFVVLDIISLLHWIAAGSSRKSIWERLGGIKVSLLDENLTYFMLRWH